MTDSPVGYRPERNPETAREARQRYEPRIDTSFSDSESVLLSEPGGDYDTTYYDPSEVDQDLRQLRPHDSERTSWGYIALLFIIFAFLSLAAWACDDAAEVAPDFRVDERGGAVGIRGPLRLSINVLGDIATVSGAVPDEEVQAAVLASAKSVYAAQNVIDQLTIDPSVVVEDGTVLVTGQALLDDERPQALQTALIDSLDLSDGGMEVERADSALLPASVAGVIGPVDGSPGAVMVVLSGAVPDEEALSQLQAAAAAVWGVGAVDVSAVSAGERTWDQAQIRLAGTVPAGDNRHVGFPDEVASRLGEGIAVDVSAVSVDENAVTVEDVEAEIASRLQAQPILFAPESADIDPASDEVLDGIVELLNTVPAVSVEIVGHTDDVGTDDENLALSQARADAVLGRLVEQGVDGTRLNARGEGENQPLVPNEDAESRAQNRRIEFNLIR